MFGCERVRADRVCAVFQRGFIVNNAEKILDKKGKVGLPPLRFDKFNNARVTDLSYIFNFGIAYFYVRTLKR